MKTKEQTDGDRVRALLEEKGKTARWLADELGINETEFSRMLNPRAFTTYHKIAIAVVLDVPRDSLFKDGG